MPPQFIYVMKDLRKVVPPSREIRRGIWLSFYPGAKIGVLGANGAGKSSLLKIMAGVDHDFQGEAWPHEGTRIGFLSQEPQLDASKNVKENVDLAVKPVRDLLKRFEEISNKFAEPMSDDQMTKLLDSQAKVQEKIDAINAWDIDRKIEIAMDALRLPPADAAVGKLSGGERRRVALCRTLLEEPDMLLLDEPTNHLDAESVAWLERYLAEFPGTVVAVTHDRYFLDNAAQWILELDRGTGIPYEGNYSDWLEQKRERLQREESSESARQKAIKKELEWVRKTAKGQQTKNIARLKRFEELNSYEYQKRNETAEIFIPVAERLGNEVIEFKNVSKGYAKRLLIDNLSFTVPPGAIVGIIGPNGAGKSTLFRMITGKEKPDKGEVKVGHTVQLSWVDQTRKLPDKKNVWEAISDGQDILTVGRFEIQSRAYLGRFNFRGQDQQKMVGSLSGGERGRLHLATTLLAGGNVLLLDEPSNDLDVETLRALEDALTEFAGTVLVISHDRWFLDRIATHILAAEGDSQWYFYQGNYHEYEEDKRERLGEEAAAPHRIRYKSLMK